VKAHPLTVLLLALAGPALAQGAFPSRPVTRIVAQKLGAKWGQTVIVENKGGAAGMIGADVVAKTKPDDYTLLMGNIGTQAINPSLYKKITVD